MTDQKKFKTENITAQLDALRPGEYLVCVDIRNRCPLATIGRHCTNGKLYELYNSLSSHEIDDHYRNVVMKHEWNIGAESVETLVCSYDMVLALLRRDIRRGIESEAASEKKNNLKSIRQKIADNGGQFIRTNFQEKEALLLGAVATDEDYYYVSVDAAYNIELDSCVGSFGDVLPGCPKPLRKFKPENVTGKTSERVFETIRSRLIDSPAMFFTPIYFNFQRPDNLDYFRQMNMLYE